MATTSSLNGFVRLLPSEPASNASGPTTSSAGEDLRQKISRGSLTIAAFVIADVSAPRPNIYYEVGYAAAREKPLLLLAREKVKIPTDLLGLEMIRYTDRKEDWPNGEDVTCPSLSARRHPRLAHSSHDHPHESSPFLYSY